MHAHVVFFMQCAVFFLYNVVDSEIPIKYNSGTHFFFLICQTVIIIAQYLFFLQGMVRQSILSLIFLFNSNFQHFSVLEHVHNKKTEKVCQYLVMVHDSSTLKGCLQLVNK